MRAKALSDYGIYVIWVKKTRVQPGIAGECETIDG